MHPDLFGIRNSSYMIMVALGIISCAVFYRILAGHQKVNNKSYNFYLFLGVASIIIGFGGSIFFQGLYDIPQRRGLFFPNSDTPTPMTFMGGLAGGVVTFLLGTILLGKRFGARQDFWTVANILSISIVSAHALGRYGCFLAGCCYGIQNDTFGVLFPGHRERRLPTNLYEAIFLTILLALLLIIFFLPQIYAKINSGKVDEDTINERKAELTKHRHKLLVIYLFAYSIFRFFLEFLRGDHRGTFLFGVISPSQIQSFIMFGIAVTLLIVVHIKGIIPFQLKSKSENLKTGDLDSEAVTTAEPEE